MSILFSNIFLARVGRTTDFFSNARLPHKCGVPSSPERRIYAAAINSVVRPFVLLFFLGPNFLFLLGSQIYVQGKII